MQSMLRRAVLALLVAVAAPAAAQTSAAAEESPVAAQQVFRQAGLEVTLPPGFELPAGGRSARDPHYQSFWSENGTRKIGILILEHADSGSSAWTREVRVRDLEHVLREFVSGFAGRPEGRVSTANGFFFRDFRITRSGETRVVGRGRMHVVQSGRHRVITILHSAAPGEPVDEQAVVAMFDSLRLVDPAPAATNRR